MLNTFRKRYKSKKTISVLRCFDVYDSLFMIGGWMSACVYIYIIYIYVMCIYIYIYIYIYINACIYSMHVYIVYSMYACR